MKWSVENGHGVADFNMLLAGDVVIDQNVIRLLKRSSADVLKGSAESLKNFNVDSIDHLDATAGVAIPR